MPDDSALQDFAPESVVEFVSEERELAASKQREAMRDVLKAQTGMKDEVNEVADALGDFAASLSGVSS